MGFVWVTNVAVGASIDAADRVEEKTNISALYTALGKNWPGNVRFPACGGAGWDMAAPCPVVWDIAVGDSIYQTPGAHPVSELQEERDKLDWIRDNMCGTNNAAFDSGEDAGDDVGANVGEDTGEDAGDNVGANVGEDTGEDAGDNVGANVGEDTGEDVSADSGADVGADNGANAGADSGADIGDNIGANVGEHSVANLGEDTGEDVSADSGANISNNPGEFITHEGLYEIGDCTVDLIGNYSVAQVTNWVANDAFDEIVVLTDFFCPGHFASVNYDDH